jgi:D-aspartate ligase
MSSKTEKGIIVLGGHVQGLGIVRTFGKYGLPVTLIDNTVYNIARHSKYCSEFHCVKDQSVLDFLIQLSQNPKYSDWIVFPTNDYHVNLLSKNRDELGQKLIISTPSWSTVHFCYNKKETYQIAKKLNIPIPDTWTPDSFEHLPVHEVSFPCIIKPAIMHEFYRKTKRKVMLCRNEKELRQNYLHAIEILPKEEVIIQNIIPGDGSCQYSACFLFLNQKTHSVLTARRLRQHPIDFGNATTYAETIKCQEIVVYGEKILREIQYEGICEVEFKYDPSGKSYKLLEINPRTWKWHILAEKSGVPLLRNLYYYLRGENLIEAKDQKDASFIHRTTDLPVQLKLLLKGIIPKTNKINLQHAVWDPKDILPSIFELLYLPILKFIR